MLPKVIFAVVAATAAAPPLQLECSHHGRRAARRGDAAATGVAACACEPPWFGPRCNHLPPPPQWAPTHLHADHYRRLLGNGTAVAECDDHADCTDGLNSALRRNGSVVVPPLHGPAGEAVPWRVRGFSFSADNALVVFAAGVEVQALKNATYLYACEKVADLGTAHGRRNLSVVGYGSTWRMWREDYVRECPHSEFRMGLAIDNCTGVEVAGITIRETGGDGVIVMSNAWHCVNVSARGTCTAGVYRKQGASRDILLRDAVFDRNYRQGMSVISAHGMVVANCTFSNTNGTAPMAGVDLEPDASEVADDPLRLTNITFDGCAAVNNSGAGFQGYFAGLRAVNGTWARGLPPTTVTFVNCKVEGNLDGWSWGCLYPDLAGEIVVAGGSTVGAARWGVHVSNKALTSLPIRYTDHVIAHVGTGPVAVPCTNVSRAKGECLPGLMSTPVNLGTRYRATPQPEGGVSITRCAVVDARPRPWFQLIGDNATAWSDVNLTDVRVRVLASAFCALNVSGGVNRVSQRNTTCAWGNRNAAFRRL